MNTQEIELSWIIAVIRRWWWLILLMALIASVTAFLVTHWMPPVYEASATLLVSPAKNSSASQYNDLMASERLALTYGQMLKDPSVLSSVKTQLGLEQSARELSNHIQTQPVRDTQLIQLTVSDSDPSQAALIANTLAQVFQARVESLSTERYVGTIKNAQDRVNSFQSKVNELEGQVEVLRSQKVDKDILLANKQVELNALREDYKAAQNNQQQTELTIAEATGKVLIYEPIQVGKDWNQGTNVASAVVSVGSFQEIGGTSTTNSNPALTYGNMIIKPSMLEKIINDLNLAVTPDQLSRKISVESVNGTRLIRLIVKDADASKAELIGTSLVNAFIAQAKGLLAEPYTDRLSNIKTQLNDTGTAIEEAQTVIATLTNEVSRLASEIDRQETILAENRTDLRESQKNLAGAQITASESSDTVVVSEPAQAPKNPSQNSILYIALAGMVGLFLGVGLAFLLEIVDNRIRTDQDIRKEFNLTSLGTIGRFESETGELVMKSHPTSASADDFRVLSTQIRRLYENQGVRSFLVTSPTPTNGKSVIVSNLGFALARIGLKVIAVDADLRLPRLHKIFDLNQEGGLTQTLFAGAIDGCVQNTAQVGLKVLTSGGTPNNPAELLASPYMEKLIYEMVKTADIVLVDCPPVLTSADASILAQVVDGVLLVLKSGQSENQTTKKTIELLRQVNARVIGVVLNAVPEKKDGYYSYYRRNAEGN